MGLLEALKQYASDAAGGSLNPEVGNTLSGLLNYGKDRARYIGGLLDDSSPINKDFKNWHDRTQLGLADLIAGKEGPQADYGYSQIMNMAGVAPVGMTAWHGSPHKFDKFSLDKIGTGEGAQAYGHGLYLAESPEVAKSYQMAGRTPDAYALEASLKTPTPRDAAHYLLSEAKKVKRGGQSSLDEVNASLLFSPKDAVSMSLAKQAIKLRNLKSNLYKTDIPDEAVARFLDWDKKLSEQAPEVRNKLLGHNVSGGRMAGDRDPLTPALLSDRFARNEGESARWAYQQLADELGGATKAADYLKQQGIPGIRYLDGGSRSAGQGSSNFVAFDPEMIRILERNGQPTGQHPWALGEWLKGQK